VAGRGSRAARWRAANGIHPGDPRSRRRASGSCCFQSDPERGRAEVTSSFSIEAAASLAYVGDELAPTPAAPVLGERIGDGLNPLTMR
jgi:hypothetical protein